MADPDGMEQLVSHLFNQMNEMRGGAGALQGVEAAHVPTQALMKQGPDISPVVSQEQAMGAMRSVTPASAPSMAAMRSGVSPHFYFLSNQSEEAAPAVSSKSALSSFDVEGARQDFPLLWQKVHGKQVIWLDNAATTQKPRQVIEALSHYYTHVNSNVHRGAHELATRATQAYEEARAKIGQFIKAQSPEEIVFVRGTTEAINLVAQSYGRHIVQPGDEIVLTTLEHHANIVPWQMLCEEKGARLCIAPINDQGEVMLEEYERLLRSRTRIVALSHVSNVLGSIVPVREMIAMAHRVGARVLIDGAQSVPHFPVNVQELDADFYAFSGHKLFGPTGIGVLYGKKDVLKEMPAWQGGGNMIDTVTFEKTTYREAPYKFEAGTGHIAGAVGLGAAIDYLNRLDFATASRYEDALLSYASDALASVRGLCPIGTAAQKAGVLSFVLPGHAPEEVGRYLDQEGIALRAGHHCAQPTMSRFGITGTIRPSVAFYNTREEIDRLVAALRQYTKAF